MDYKKVQFPVILAVAVILFLILFQFSYFYDNKYTHMGPAAKMGMVSFDIEEYDSTPFIYLIDGWEYYAGKLHTPETIRYDTPDQYTYIGRYAGFDMGDPEKSPYGCATYRLNIFIGKEAKTYALELPQIYTDWKLYINGELKASGGKKNEKYKLISSENDRIVFQSADKVEIIVAVSSKTGLYSGFTYPPAFGSVKGVSDLLNERLLIHIVAASMAVFTGILFLCIGFGCHHQRPYQILFCNCICFAVAVSYPMVQTFQLNGTVFSSIERFCYYGMFFMFILLQANILKLSKKFYICMAAFGCVVLLTICLEPFIMIYRAEVKYRYGYFLTLYKLTTAAWLLITSIFAIRQVKTGAKPLLAGACIFSAALIMDRAFPLFEPMRGGWPVETAGFAYICIAAGILWWDTMKTYKEKLILETEKQSLIETNRLKSEFLSGISHELQTPIAVISGYAQLTSRLVNKGIIEYDELLDNQQQIVLESGRMERMIRQLLDISRIESGCFQLNKEKVLLAPMIENIADTYFPVIDKNSNQIQCDISYDLPLVDCDRERIEMVFINLLKNASRHTKNGIITVSAEVLKNYIQIRIKDTGEGILPDIVPHLFEQYLNCNGSRINAAGTGLGLYLCKKTIEAHGGEIGIETIQSVGTEVYFTLPILEITRNH